MRLNARGVLCLICVFLVCGLPAGAAVVNATWNAATDVPVAASSYTATGNTVNFTLNFAPPTGTNLTVINNTGLPFISGTFSNLAQGQAVTLTYNSVSYNYVAHYYGGTGNDLMLVWANQRVFGWGSNTYGEVGDGTYTARKTMVPVTATGVLAGKTIMALENSGSNGLALCSDGTLAAWGTNYSGALGNGTGIDSNVPVQVSNGSGSALNGKTVVAIAMGGCSMALCSDGTVATWGYNGFGNLGNGTTGQRNVPTAVNTASGTSALYGKTVVAIAAGSYNCMALCSDGTLTSWGQGNFGQLGNGGTADSMVPVLVSTASGTSSLYNRTVSAIAVGSYFSMAVCTDGTVSAWGDNYYGQLGNNGVGLSSPVPVLVNTTSGVSALYNKTVVSVAAGYSHALSLCSDGTVAAWGSNGYGQLGNNSNTQKNVPVLVNTASGGSALFGKTVLAITTGGYNYYDSRALCTDGTLAAWGLNAYYHLGNNASADSNVPVAVITAPLAAGERVVNPANGMHAAMAATLVAEPPPTLVTQAASAVGSTTAVLNGTANPNGGAVVAYFDYGTTTAYGSTVTAAPAPVSGGSATAVSSALTGLSPLTTYHFRLKGGTYVGGDQTFTTLNNNASLSGLSLSSGTLSPAFAVGITSYSATVPTSTSSITVTPVVADSNATVTVNGSIVASGSASAAVSLATGDNAISVVVTAQDGTTTQAYKVVVTRQFSGTVEAAWAAAGDVPLSINGFSISSSTVNLALNFAPATGTNLTVVNNTGLGFISGTFDNLAQGQVVTLSYGGVSYKYVASYYGGTGNDLVLVWAGQRIVAWGDNTYGKVGDGTISTARTTPVAVTSTGVLWGKTILALADGFFHSVALCSDGSVATWGNSSSSDSYVPVLVNTTSGVSALYGKTVVAIAAGLGSSMALCSDGTVAVWGGNNLVPVAVSAASGSALYGKSVVGISAGSGHYLALCSDGTVVTWGVNSYGQLGNGTTTDSTVPVAVSTSGSSALNGKTVVAVSAGRQHSLALCSDGSVVSWGSNLGSALGNSNYGYATVPVPVSTASGTSALYGKTVSAIAGGYDLSMALCTDGTVAVWGNATHGQLGNGTNNISDYPVAVSTASGVSALYGKTVASIAIQSPNGNSLRALCTDGTLACWGVGNGNLGNGGTSDSNVPVAVSTSTLGAGELPVTPSLSTNSAQSMALLAEPLPAVTTTAATALNGTYATLNGTVDAQGGCFMLYFDYGLTTAYGSRIGSVPDRVFGSGAAAFSAVPTGLTPHTTYHYRINANGFTGADQSFTTLNNDATLSALESSAGSLSPAVTAGVFSYALPGVSAQTSSITLTPTQTDSNARLTINGVSSPSGSPQTVNLVPGGNVITVLVTAEDGITRQPYTISVYRALPATVAADYGSASVVPLSVNGVNAAGSSVSFSLSYAPVPGTTLTVIDNAAPGFITGAFDNLSHGQAVTLSYNGSSYRFVANYYGGTGNDLVLVWAGNRIYSWGSNAAGTVGDGTTTDRSLMVPVTMTGVLGGKTIIALANGYQHNLALCSDGTVAAWGQNGSGQLGINSTISSSVPVAVNTASGVSALYGKTVVAIAAGYTHSMALCSDGTVVTWGGSLYGALGNPATQNNVPVAVNTSGTSALNGRTVVAICVGSHHSMALCTDGTLVAWGFNIYGQLGNNTNNTSVALPMAVNTSSGVSALYGKTVVAIAAGYYHSIALCSDGSVAAWGYASSSGILGDGALTTQSSVPVRVNTGSSSALYNKSVKAVAAGYNYNLALCTDGAVVAWGDNSSGQLGDNTTTNRPLPVLVNATGGVSALAGKTVLSIAVHDATTMTCRALCSDGTLATWGWGALSYLGTGATANSLVPAAVVTTPLMPGEQVIPSAGPPGSTALSMVLVAEPPAAATTLAATSVLGTTAVLSGLVTTSGSNVGVSFDYGSTPAYGSSVVASPATLPGNVTATASAALSGLQPLTTYHYRINVGDFTGADQTFTTLNNDASLASLTASTGSLSPAFASTTLAYTLAVDTSTSSVTFTPMLTDSNATLKLNGFSIASGSANAINLGYGDNVFHLTATSQDAVVTQDYVVDVVRPPPMVVAASYATGADVPLTTNGLTATGRTVNFSLNYAPATGAALTVVNNTAPGLIIGTFDNLAQGQAVALSYNGTTYNYVAHYYGGTGNDLVLVWASQRVFGWGSNTYGEVGDGSVINRTRAVPASTGALAGKTILSIVAGLTHSLALCSDGTLVAWGDNRSGQLGDNTVNARSTPGLVNTTAGVSALAGKVVVAIAAGGYHSLALCSDGTLVAWGADDFGQLGDNTSTYSSVLVPVAVSSTGGSALNGRSVAAIAAGWYHSLALCSDGTLVSWGRNGYGQLGDGGSTDSPLPKVVSTANRSDNIVYGKTISAIAAGAYHSALLCTDGTLAAWGNNSYGQLGNNTYTDSPGPAAVSFSSGISALSGKTVSSFTCGAYHCMALCTDGTPVAWGYNTYGQLGDATNTTRPAPVKINTTSGTSALYNKTVTALVGGGSQSVALCADGTLCAWGVNNSGQVGDGTTTSRSAPVLVLSSNLANGEQFATLSATADSAHTLVLAAAPPYTTVTTQAATTISGTTAQLNGTVVAAGSSMDVTFEYGTTTAYGQQAAGQPTPVTGGAATPVSAALSGLAPGTLYHYRVNGTTGAGTLNGADLTFTTLNNNATLSGLVLGSGTLSPAFDAGTTSYTASVPYLTTTLVLTPTLADSHASMKINGAPFSSGVAGWPLLLSEGSNVISIVVTAEDGSTTQTYTLTVTRAAGPSLSSLALDSGTLSPALDGSTLRYAVAVSTTTSTITLTPTLADATATLKVNGTAVSSGSATSPINLAYGNTTLTLICTAQDGTTTKTYTIVVTRALPAVFSATFASASTQALRSNGLTLSGTAVSLTMNFTPLAGTSLTLVNNTSSGFINGTFSNLAQGQLVELTYGGKPYHFTANYFGGNGNDLVLQWADTRGFAWGSNASAQLGTSGSSSAPAQIVPAGALTQQRIRVLAAGGSHSLALCWDGSVAAWGGNNVGQLGNASSTTTSVITPVAVSTASGTSALNGKSVVAVSAGFQHSLALCDDGTVASWGTNSQGQLGTTAALSPASAPQAVNTTVGSSALAGKTVTAIAAGNVHNLALCSDGSIVTWGSNASGQLGSLSPSTTPLPVAVNTTSGVSALYGKTVIAIAAGTDHSLALCSDGTVAAWGSNAYGQLGNNTTTSRPLPTPVNTTSGVSALYGKTVVAIAAGGYHSMALCSDNNVVTWGLNANGQLGDATTTTRLAPTFINTTSGTSALYAKIISSLSAGAYHSLALCNDGKFTAWGANTYYQLGGSFSAAQQRVPLSVPVGGMNTSEVAMATLSSASSVHNLQLVGTPPPALSTLAAVSVGTTTATLAGAATTYGGYTIASFEYGPTTAYGSSTSPSTVNNSGIVFNIPITGLAPGTTYHYRIKGGTYSGQDITFTTLSLQQSWRQQNFGTTANTGTTADAADYDGDGICNLLEYALNLSPTAASNLPVTTKMNGGNYEYTYTRSTSAVNAGTVFMVEASPTLSTPAWSSSGITQTVLSDDGTTQQVKAVIPLNAASTMFVHLSVTAPP